MDKYKDEANDRRVVTGDSQKFFVTNLARPHRRRSNWISRLRVVALGIAFGTDGVSSVPRQRKERRSGSARFSAA